MKAIRKGLVTEETNYRVSSKTVYNQDTCWVCLMEVNMIRSPYSVVECKEHIDEGT